MPYILLIIGLIIGVFALYKFFMIANSRQIKAAFLIALMITLCVTLIFMAVTGRLPAAIGILVALAPIVMAYMRHRRGGQKHGGPESEGSPSQGPMTRKEAYRILGLEEGASEEDIKKAYKELMKKMHPDQKGSPWMATKLNEAKDFLLKDK